jgi:hypothetical protein
LTRITMAARIGEKIPGWVERLLIPTIESRVRAIVKDEVSHLEKASEARFQAMDEKFDTRLDAFDQRFNALEERFDTKLKATDQKLETRFDAMADRFDSIEENFDAKLGTIDAKMDSIKDRFPVIQDLAEIKARLAQLEKKQN